MEKILETTDSTGTISAHIDISVQEWEDILSNPNITTNNYKETLLAYYNEPMHTTSCHRISMKNFGNGDHYQRYNSLLTNFGKAVVKYLNRFYIVDHNDNKRYWLVPMSKGSYSKDGKFDTTLRPELVQAIENLKWVNHLSWIPFYMEMAEKLLLFKDNRKQLLDIVYGLDNKYVGYIKNDDGNHVLDIDPFTVMGIINRGITDKNRIILCKYFKEKFEINADIPSDFNAIPFLKDMMATFFWRENETTDIQPLWNFFETAINYNEGIFRKQFDIVSKQKGIKWNISMGLFWIRPYDYISLDSTNRDYLQLLGFNVFKEKEIDSNHYLSLLQDIKNSIATHKIKEKNIPEISYNAWVKNDIAPNDTVQHDSNYWLVGYSFNGKNSQIEIFTKESIWEGHFGNDNTSDQKLLPLALSIKKGDVLILKSTSTKGKKHNQPFLRVKAIGVVISDITSEMAAGYTACKCSVKYYSINDKDFDIAELSSFRRTIHLADEKAKDIIEYANEIINENKTPQMPPAKYTKYIELLKSSKNLVLTGAPGTGKTYMAQALAEEMGAEIQFVQFHPSYDYTDFVEGLRPVDTCNGQIAFERKDGVFKEFCKDAMQNLIDSAKSIKNLTDELTWEKKLYDFAEKAIEDGTQFETVNGSKFFISEIKERSIILRNEQNEKTYLVSVNINDILELLTQNVQINIVRDIRNYFNRTYSTQPDSYAFVIINEVRKIKSNMSVKANKIDQKPFVFIIDEINRGEVSKIFGELFYAIDPGYRGNTKVKVKTQYQNLISETDIFHNGFFVPDNVYILATMNDIDRSVESMDFAIRRRFTWKEITPSDTQDMLDILGESLSAEAKATMTRLNESIADTEGLGDAYMVGPSYFIKLKDNGGNFSILWEMNIEPLLKEYLRGFRKASELLEKFNKVYFNKEEEKKTNASDLFEEE